MVQFGVGSPQEAVLWLHGFSKFSHGLEGLASIKQARRTGSKSLPSLRCRISYPLYIQISNQLKVQRALCKEQKIVEFTCPHKSLPYFKNILSHHIPPITQSHGASEFGSTSSLKSTVTFSEEMSLFVVEISSSTSKRPMHGANRD